MNRLVMCAWFFFLAPALIARPARDVNQSPQQSSTGAKSSSQPAQGERIFAANCSRCHQAPMSLSPRITGTVIMHMRIRARLSSTDERLLLKYLAP